VLLGQKRVRPTGTRRAGKYLKRSLHRGKGLEARNRFGVPQTNKTNDITAYGLVQYNLSNKVTSRFSPLHSADGQQSFRIHNKWSRRAGTTCLHFLYNTTTRRFKNMGFIVPQKNKQPILTRKSALGVDGTRWWELWFCGGVKGKRCRGAENRTESGGLSEIH
jgi:hypothetical protein